MTYMYHSIWITVAILHLLHSSGVVGQTQSGLFLSLKGTPINDDGFVNASDIDANDHGLLCHTNATNCCTGALSPGDAEGEWNFPSGTAVDSNTINANAGGTDFFYRNRGQSVVRLNRQNSPSERGRFRCELRGDTIYVNILNIGPVSISPSTPVTVTAGETVNLQCSVDVTPHSLPDGTSTPEFEWFFRSTLNSPLTSITTYSSSTYSSTLQLTSVSESDGGMYTCRLRGNHRTAVSTTIIVIRFSVSITPSGTNTAGETYSLVCSVTVTGSTDTPTIVWLDPINSQVPSEMVSTTGGISTLTFNPLSTSHAGTYTCRATLTSGGMETDIMIVTVQVDGMFQLRLKGTDICSQWYNENSNKSGQYSKFIKEAVTKAVTRRCKCQFLVSNLLEDSFSCEESTNFLTYRSTLRGTYNFNGSQITDFIQDWVSSGPRIKIGYDREYVRIDSSCPAAISSLDEPDCGHDTNNGNSGCQTYGDNPGSFTQCAQELDDSGIARCIEGCVVRNG